MVCCFFHAPARESPGGRSCLTLSANPRIVVGLPGKGSPQQPLRSELMTPAAPWRSGSLLGPPPLPERRRCLAPGG